MERRDFIKIFGMASATIATSCNLKKATDSLIPIIIPPDDGVIPGVPVYRISTCTECPAHCGQLVKLMNNIPVKLEGNPDHPVSKGALCLRGQISLERLYHPDRLKTPLLKSENQFKSINWETALNIITDKLKYTKQDGKRNIYLSGRATGELSILQNDFCTQNSIELKPYFEIFPHSSLRKAYDCLLGINDIPFFNIEKCDLLLTLGAELLDTYLSPVFYTGEIAKLKDKNRYWKHISSQPSLTSINSISPQWIIPGSEPSLLAFLIRNSKGHISSEILRLIPEESASEISKNTGCSEEFLKELKNKLANSEHPLLISGGSAVSGVNGYLTSLYSALLQIKTGMISDTIDFRRTFDYKKVGDWNDLQKLSDSFRKKEAGTVIFANLPVTPLSEKIWNLLPEASFSVILSDLLYKEFEKADLILPLSHPLESYGEVNSFSDVVSFLKPVIPALGESLSEGEILYRLMKKQGNFSDLLKNKWNEKENGNKGYALINTVQLKAERRTERVLEELRKTARSDYIKGNYLRIIPSVRTFDGRSAVLTLSKEIPDPVSTVSYGDFLSVSQKTAAMSGVKDNSVISVETQNGSFSMPVKILECIPDNCFIISCDSVSGLEIPFSAESGELITTLPVLNFKNTDQQGSLAILSGEMKAGKREIVAGDKDHEKKHKSLYSPHEHKTYRWAMAIDLDKCTGCSACVGACYIENNIPASGKKEHIRGREMSWLRIEPYYIDSKNPVFIPVMCQQCDNAPCESVCPVYATYHNPEGINTQIYNRCVGTRYCSNNCPYKARRFNWFENKKKPPLDKMVNPELAERPKGVMEKCNFCIQRIRSAGDKSKDEKRLISEGDIITACAQTCPAKAIHFGNILDRNSMVYRLSKSERSYRLFKELGTEPAVYYLRKRNLV